MSSTNFNAQDIRESLQRLAAAIKHLFQSGETEERRKVFLIISVALCLIFFIPIYFVDFHMHSDFVRFDMSDTFSLFQLMTDPVSTWSTTREPGPTSSTCSRQL